MMIVILTPQNITHAPLKVLNKEGYENVYCESFQANKLYFKILKLMATSNTCFKLYYEVELGMTQFLTDGNQLQGVLNLWLNPEIW